VTRDDFGVGALHKVVGRTEGERRQALGAIEPFWDGNEVWLIVAAAGMFAAWYATLFSGLYLAMLLILVALIARGVSFAFHWPWATTIAGGALPVLLGIGLGDLVAGLPVNADGEFTRSVAGIFTAYGAWTGVTFLSLALLHGAAFMSLRTTGPVRERSRAPGVRLAVAAAVAVLVFALWSVTVLSVLAVVLVVAAGGLLQLAREGWSFVASAAAMASAVASLFVDLYPNLLVSSTDPAYSLTVAGAASGEYALKVMTVVAVVLFPVVLLHQGWTYRVFRARVTDSA
jgi:cytochrome d ubiquinol oxidase subunit II